jgi:TonB family protein
MEKETPMKSHSQLLINAGFLVVTMLHAVAADVKVIANPSVKSDSISVGELRRVLLLQRKALNDGSPVVPVLQKSGPAHDAFFRQYLGRDYEEVWTYYQGLVFTGKASIPKQLGSDAEVVEYVAHTKGAIGYVSPNSGTDGVKSLVVVPDEGKRERTLVKRVEPEYPDTLKRLDIGGIVRLRVTISPKGSVDSVELLGGNPILAENAIKAVRQWIYSPGSSQSKIEVMLSF